MQAALLVFIALLLAHPAGPATRPVEGDAADAALPDSPRALLLSWADALEAGDADRLAALSRADEPLWQTLAAGRSEYALSQARLRKTIEERFDVSPASPGADLEPVMHSDVRR